MSISFLFSWLEYVHLSTGDNGEVHIFILRLNNNYHWINLVFLMGPCLRIRITWSLSTHPPVFVLLLLQFRSPSVGLLWPMNLMQLHPLLLLLNINITLHPVNNTVSSCLSSHFEQNWVCLLGKESAFSFILLAELPVIKRRKWIFPNSIKNIFGKWSSILYHYCGQEGTKKLHALKSVWQAWQTLHATCIASP